MKTLIALLVLTAGIQAQAKENIVCVMQEAANPENQATYKIDFSKFDGDEFNGYPENGLPIGDREYSYSIDITRKGSLLDVTVTFQENLQVEDEIAQESYRVDLSKAVKGKPIITDEMTENGIVKMKFFCFYNR